MLSNQKVWGSILSQAVSYFILLLSYTNFHEFLHRNYKGQHEFKTREVHEKLS